jgi:hypothetical protein
VVLTYPREKNKNDRNQMMNLPHHQVRLPLDINALLLTMIVETKATMRRDMMITRMNLHHHKVHSPVLLPLIMMTGKTRPMMWENKKFTSSTPIPTKGDKMILMKLLRRNKEEGKALLRLEETLVKTNNRLEKTTKEHEELR